jgi:hypothetical protein
MQLSPQAFPFRHVLQQATKIAPFFSLSAPTRSKNLSVLIVLTWEPSGDVAPAVREAGRTNPMNSAANSIDLIERPSNFAEMVITNAIFNQRGNLQADNDQHPFA